jgi:hypothetical protein
MTDRAATEYPSVTVRGARRRGWWVLGGLLVVLVAGAALAVRVAVAQLPPGTTLAGVEVRTPAQAGEVAEDLATRLLALQVELSTAAGTTSVPAGRLGATPQVQAVRDAAEAARGLDGWLDRFTGGGPVVLPFEVEVADVDLDDVAAEVSSDPVDGRVEITPTGVEVTEPVVGVRTTAAQLRDAAAPQLAALATTPVDEWPTPLSVEVEGEELQPTVTQVAVDAAVAEVERLTAEPVAVVADVTPEDAQTVDGQGVPVREEARLLLAARELRALLATEVDPDAVQAERLRVVADPEEPPASLVQFLERAAVVPEMDVAVRDRSATPTRGAGPEGPGGPADRPAYADVTTVTGRLEAEVTTPGLEPDLPATVEAIVAAAGQAERTARVQGTPINSPDPALLGIRQPVGTYTTFFTAGEPRTRNIARIAELVDGTLIPPGANYELNHAVGERTEAGGFVAAGAILEGEFVSDVGGGVSQFATTFFNAMWFTGVDIITHTPHTYWFDRYPAGREATIDYPGVDLELNNNSPHWILVDTTSTPDSVTVTFWSTPYFEVTQSIGPREPVPGQDFRVTYSRTSVAPPVPELEIAGGTDVDSFTKTYGIPPAS